MLEIVVREAVLGYGCFWAYGGLTTVCMCQELVCEGWSGGTNVEVDTRLMPPGRPRC